MPQSLKSLKLLNSWQSFSFNFYYLGKFIVSRSPEIIFHFSLLVFKILRASEAFAPRTPSRLSTLNNRLIFNFLLYITVFKRKDVVCFFLIWFYHPASTISYILYLLSIFYILTILLCYIVFIFSFFLITCNWPFVVTF